MKRSNLPPDDGGINDWGLTYNTDYAVSARKKRDNDRLSFSVKLCPSCNIAYELVLNQYKQESQVHYYNHFYKRGLHKQTCPKCM